jgi:hypothetical protein
VGNELDLKHSITFSFYTTPSYTYHSSSTYYQYIKMVVKVGINGFGEYRFFMFHNVTLSHGVMTLFKLHTFTFDQNVDLDTASNHIQSDMIRTCADYTQAESVELS